MCHLDDDVRVIGIRPDDCAMHLRKVDDALAFPAARTALAGRTGRRGVVSVAAAERPAIASVMAVAGRRW